MSTMRQVPPITLEEYLEGEKNCDIRHEYVGGQVYSMVGASEAHNLIVGNLFSAVHSQLRGTGCRAFTGFMKLRIGNDFYYPDVFVGCEHTDAEPYFKTRPVLIVEVLSPSTATWDSPDKRVAYQSLDSLQEYVLAEQDRREVRLHRRDGEEWETVSYAGGAEFRLASVDLTLSLDEIYRDVLP